MKAKKYIVKDNMHLLYGRKCTLKYIGKDGFLYVNVEGYKGVEFKFKECQLEEV